MNDFDPVGEWMAAFPEELTEGQIDIIRGDVTDGDEELWREMILEYSGNIHWKRRNIGTVIRIFRQRKREAEGSGQYGAYQQLGGLSIREARELGAFDDYERRKRLEQELLAEDVRNSQPLLRGCDASAD